MPACRLATILADLTLAEAIDTPRIHSVADQPSATLLGISAQFVREMAMMGRPFEDGVL
jgi:hypothetical protein